MRLDLLRLSSNLLQLPGLESASDVEKPIMLPMPNIAVCYRGQAASAVPQTGQT